ncbi:GntR family transcriptional regulator [Fictibacillus enclensis]|uniref:GntR family transcriptional regulator n=1 Tax=Fictibacillus enclensis TaxID=1017270 RepID=UPI0025A13F56|nr:GntR family transcriptional regulator [Fictibacillus enclensis]MDM5339068.1 GntR family transcriptional regulator [Fictibacillus enclensis]
MKTTIRNGSTRDYVYQTIKNEIINWELKPGTKISEKEIGEKLQVSRTPVREAFMKLAQEELLGIYPQIGTIVSRIDLELVEEARFIRENIEKAIVRIACVQIGKEDTFRLETNIAMQELCLERGTHQQLFELDEDFHKIIFEITNKQRTWNIIRKMNSHFDRLRVLRLASNHDWSIVISQHKEIFKAILEKNQDKAEQVMVNHLKLVNFEKEKLKEMHPDYFL